MRTVISFEEFYESIWLKIPEVWRNSDIDYGRPLQLLTLTLAQHFYYSFYLKIASMDELFDPDTCPDKYLPFLAATVNWKLLGTDSVSWRNQIRHAPLLYKIKGTRKAITIAEKLVGYSVFMTELYRDYTGKIVPKEKIFNNFPVTTKIKPWFRKTSVDISTDIFNDTFSDLLPSFNLNSGDITEFGSLLLPRHLKKTKSTKIALSTVPTYNPKTGLGSIARLAKIPRINVVLKKDLDLDHTDQTGKYTDANLNEAVDLFMQFKPFHVYINDLLVLYSLSDYVLGTQKDMTAGSGDLPGETILYREHIDIFVTVAEQDKISYYNQEQLGSCDADSLEVKDTSLFKGALETKHKVIQELPIFSTVTDVERLTKLGFPLSGYAKNYQTNQGKSIWSAYDFIPIDSPDEPNNPSHTILVDKWTQAVRYSSILPEPSFHFFEVPLQTEYVCSIKQLYNSISSFIPDSSNWYSNIESINLDKAGFCKDAVTISGISYSNLSTPPAPWSLKGVTSFLNSGITTLHYNVFNSSTKTNTAIPLLSGSEQDKTINLLRALVKEDMLLVVSYLSEAYILKPKMHYAYDTIKESLVLNSKQILSLFTYSGSNLLSDMKLHILYASLVPVESGFSVVTANRDIQIANTRSHSKFNRITYLDNTSIQTEIDTAHYTPEIEFDETLGVLVENLSKTKLYRESLPRIFARNSLHEENTGTPYPAVSYDPSCARDTSKWKVYTEPADSLYLGAERLAKTVWANYFNVPFSNSATVPYDSIDTSGNTQLETRQSFRWLATLNHITENHPQFFLASRMDVDSRHSLWTRGSAQKLARPYVGSSRSTRQGFRDANALFNRTENLPDYHISLLANYNTDNYKYTVDGIDYTDMYRNPTIEFEKTPVPSTEAPIVGKTKILNNVIEYPSYKTNDYADLGYVPQYDGPFDFVSRETYYTDSVNLKPSLYANNIRTDMCPYSGELLDDFADPLELNIDGLQKHIVNFTVTSDNDKEFILQKTNIFVSWREVNTGISVGTGLFPLIDYSKVRPSVRVLKNGIELAYGVWSLASNPNRIIFSHSMLLMPSDIITVEYYTLDGVEIPIYPADPDTNVVYTADNTQLYVDTFTIPLTFTSMSKEVLYTHTFLNRPIITWNRADTGTYISVSADKGMVAISPLPKLYRNLAMPNIRVLKNGIDVAYKKYWKLIAIPSTTVSFRLVFQQAFVHSMQPTDVISISYTGSI